MDTQINSRIIKKDGREYLAVSTGLRSRFFKNTNSSLLKAEPGRITSGSSKAGEVAVEEWPVNGFTDIDDIIYFYGPKLSGRLLCELQDAASPRRRGITPELTAAFAAALRTAAESGPRPAEFSLAAAFSTDDGRPALEPGTVLWGITELEIEKGVRENEYRVSYLKWNTAVPRDEDGAEQEPPSAEVWKITDIIYFETVKKAWRIEEMKRTASEFN